MTGLSEDKRARLIELFELEAALLSEMEEQTELRAQFLKEGEIDKFTESIEKRQWVIDKLDGLHQETEVLMQSYMSSPSRDDEIDAKRAEIKGTLETLIKSDREIYATVRQVADGYSKEIRKLGENRRGLGGYIYPDAGHTGLFDKKT